MKILVTKDVDNELTDSLLRGLNVLGHEATSFDISQIPQAEQFNKELYDTLISYDVVHDITKGAYFFNFLKANKFDRVLYHCFNYLPAVKYRFPVVCLSQRQTMIMENSGMGFELEWFPQDIFMNRYIFFQSLFWVYPDIDVTKIKKRAAEKGTCIIMGYTPYEMTPRWYDNMKPLFEKYPLFSLSNQLSASYKDLKPEILPSLPEMTKRFSEYQNIIYYSVFHTPFPDFLLWPLAMGNHIITTSFGGQPELIFNGKNGFIANGKETIEKALEKTNTINPYVPARNQSPMMARSFEKIYKLIIEKQLKAHDYAFIAK